MNRNDRLSFESGAATWRRGAYVVSTDRSRIDPARLLACMREEAWWVRRLSVERFERALENSLSFVVMFENGDIAGFGRVVTDGTLFAYIRDIFVVKAHRGHRLSRWLVQCMLDHPDLGEVGNWTLATMDAHGVYAPLGFLPAPNGKFMQRLRDAQPEELSPVIVTDQSS